METPAAMQCDLCFSPSWCQAVFQQAASSKADAKAKAKAIAKAPKLKAKQQPQAFQPTLHCMLVVKFIWTLSLYSP